jgi:hypothetical protein
MRQNHKMFSKFLAAVQNCVCLALQVHDDIVIFTDDKSLQNSLESVRNVGHDKKSHFSFSIFLFTSLSLSACTSVYISKLV